ncbi:PfkB domain protein [Cellulosilyticum lentocellum DSM 5427]|uniref:PfkB domain protein n=2 Tax=Cellulosilyticum lentocellum TaxID=29360 RepID=F2JI84_CELLD|nr:PfkB domain protein [Cellulosilyticum lentocellum DSM 5427]
MTMENNKPYALVFGIAIYDIFGFSYATYRPYDSNPGKVKVSCGGVCRNIAENMSLVGTNTQFISILGDDEKGKDILRQAEKVGLDMSNTLIVHGGSTPTYMAILDENGEMVSAVVDTKLANEFSKEALSERASIIENAEYMFLGADNPPFIEHIVTTYQGKTKFVLDPVSAAKAARIKHLLHYFHTVKPNRHEAEVLCGFEVKTHEDARKAGAYLRGLGVQNVFISLDVDGVYYNDGKEEGIIKANALEVINVTGAGDAFVAGIGAGYMANKSTVEIVKYAIAMSNITIAHEETINPNMAADLVEAYVREAQWQCTTFE